MMWLRAARAVGIISFASVAVASNLRTERSAGLTFDYSTKASVEPAGPTGAGAFAMTGRGIATASGSTRVDIVTADGVSLYKVGDYIVITGGKTSLVHPDTKTYVDLDAQSNNMMKNLPPAVLAQMTITELKGAVEKVSGNEQLNGQSSEHHRTNIGYSMNVMGQTIPNTVITDLWLAKLPFKVALPVSGGSKIASAGPMAEMVQKQYDLIPRPDGFTMIKSLTASTVAIMGQTLVTTISTEMSNFKEGDVDVSKFVVPSDFAKADK